MKLNIRLIIYYVLMLFAMSTWTNMQSSPPMPLRFLFLFALVYPLYFYRTGWTPIILSLFLLVADNSFATSLLPAGHFPYVLILFVLASHQGKINRIETRPIALILLIYTFIINTIMGNTIDRGALYCGFFFLFAFPFFVKKNDESFPHLFSYAFIASSLTLSLLLIIFGSQFAQASLGDYESFTWKDTNYWANVVGMGVVAALIELFNSKGKKYIRLFLWSVVTIELLILFVTASRGSIMAVAVAFLVLYLKSNAGRRIKTITTIGIIGIIIIMYFTGIMDRLIFRMFEEDTFATGNGRVDIWMYKLEKFYQGDLYHRIFGYGTEGGRALGADGTIHKNFFGLMSTHNDFLSYLCYYGYIGLAMFLVLLYRPLKGNNKNIVLCGTAFITTSIFTLEPLAGGNIAWFAFLFYIYSWSQVSNSTVKIPRNRKTKWQQWPYLFFVR